MLNVAVMKVRVPAAMAIVTATLAMRRGAPLLHLPCIPTSLLPGGPNFQDFNAQAAG
jgi:hypothetical protein